VLYSFTQVLTAACAAARSANGTASSVSSRRSDPWNRSIFPVVVGERGWVSRRVMPLSRQIRSNSTSPPLPNRSVNCLPLSVSTSPGTPNSRSAEANARQTARPVARATTEAMTQ
jgi:hypothetical protein